jgi:quinol-cytochrome oxidoreductase complex cytochrome b subunit
VSVVAPPPTPVRPPERRESAARSGFFSHLHPSLVTERALEPGATVGLGVVAFVLVAILLASGVLLGLHYVPTASGAYASVVELQLAVPLGRALRALHRWSADGLLVVCLLHLGRVLATAAYRGRALNWLVGLALLGLVCAAAFSGYALAWDQRAYWGARVVAGLLDHVPVLGATLARLLFGAPALGEQAVGRLHAVHVSLLPALVVGGSVWHLWRVRRDGGLARPAESPVLVPASPHLTGREAALALTVLAVMVLVATLAPAPLGPAADLVRPSNPEKAPWYFLGLQELASRSTVAGALALPLATLVLLVLLPLVDPSGRDSGLWVPGRAERRAWALAVVLTGGLVVASYAVGGTSVWTPIAPLAAASLLLVAGPPLLGRRAALRAALVALVTAFALFTAAGACRGPDWTLQAPWQESRRA